MNCSELELLRVYNFDKKIRYGVRTDGGYVIADLNHSEGDVYDCYISAGISNEESFSRDFIKAHGMNASNSFGYDGTIHDYPWQYTRDITFVKKNIGENNTQTETNMRDLTDKYNNIFLKIDIEGGEYPWLKSMDESALSKFKQIVIEFHGLTTNEWGCVLPEKIKCIEKLNKTHYIVHAHGNNHGPFNVIPDVLELTYVRKDYFDTVPAFNSTPLPIPKVDFPNCIIRRDFNLTFFPFCEGNA